MIPGEYFITPGNIECNAGLRTAQITVVNTGDRPVQIGSHYHFFEVNRQLSFERETALGMRLNIAAGTAVRFEPGEQKQVELVALGGKHQAHGHNNLVNGDVTATATREKALGKLAPENFKNKTV